MASSLAAFAATPFMSVAAGEPAEDKDLGEHIDLKSLRPAPKVRIKEVILRRETPYWLGWPGTSYDLAGHRKEYEAAFQQMADKTGIALQMEPKPIEKEELVALEEAVRGGVGLAGYHGGMGDAFRN